ncbi:MAG: hypothetical protein KGL93_00125 [Gemmatimonadota bacterium]|nr:hypothetical protein [Gemmatimonadota bacterium]
MHDDPFEPPLADAARRYHEPPQLDEPARDAMWDAIAHAQFGATERRRARWTPGWIGLAAAVVLGVALGRFTPLDAWLHGGRRVANAPTAVASAPAAPPSVPAVYESTTSQYLGQTAALLLALPTEVHAGRADRQFIGRAQNLLLTTRLLLDSPAGHDARFRGLLDDLEVVLAQVVRMQSDPNATDLDLITQALEQRDVLPRLRTAAADISAD